MFTIKDEASQPQMVGKKQRKEWYNSIVGTISSIILMMTENERVKLLDFLEERYCLDCGTMLDKKRPDDCPNCGEYEAS